MSQRWRWLVPVAGAVAGLSLLMAGTAGQAGQGDSQSLNDLDLEVAALQTLHALRATRAQMEGLQKLAGETADRPPARAASAASGTFRKTLAALREALVADRDEEGISRLNDKLEQLRSTEKPDLDDDIEITDEAREQAPRVLRTLTPAQVAGYLGGYADTIPDPLSQVREALAKVRRLDDKNWKETRGRVGEDVGELVAGLDVDKAAEVSARVGQLLIVARGLKEAEFKTQRRELERKARRLIGDLGPTDVLRHVMERHLAELLSNPRLGAALDARLKSAIVRKRARER